MKTMLKLFAIAAGLVLGASVAHAQAGGQGSGAPAGPGYAAENLTVRNGGDTAERDAMAARDAEMAKVRTRRSEKPKTARSVPATPDQVTVGSEVRDPKGIVIGRIDSVSMGAAVVNTTGGKVEVPLEAFGMNNKGLLVGMSKADFDAAVAAANKPAG